MRLEAFHKKNLVKAQNIIDDSVSNQIVLQVSSLNTSMRFDSLTKLFEGKNIDRNMTLRNQLKNVKIQKHRPCSHKDLSNQRTTSSGERRSEECRSGDGHLGWPPRIMKFIHLRNVFQKKVITFSRLGEEEEAHL